MAKYFPILLSKAGEFKALSKLSAAVKLDTSPVIEVLSGNITSTENHLVNNWDFDNNQVLIDFSLYSGFDKTAYKNLFQNLNNAGINFVPVIQQNSDPAYIAFVKYLVATYDCKVCIRSSNGSGGFANYNTVIAGLMTQVGTTRSTTIQLFDLGLSEINNYNILSTVAITLIGAIPSINQWADIIIASSSFPDNLSAFTPPNRVYRIRRYEWDIWNAVKAAIGKYVKYGDYGTKYPFYSVTNFSGTCSIKYTAPNEYVIYRGDKSENHADGNGQYITFAGRLIATTDYSGVGFSWGDDHINRIAHEVMSNPKRKPGSAQTWVEISQNHHITLLHSLL